MGLLQVLFSWLLDGLFSWLLSGLFSWLLNGLFSWTHALSQGLMGSFFIVRRLWQDSCHLMDLQDPFYSQ